MRETDRETERDIERERERERENREQRTEKAEFHTAKKDIAALCKEEKKSHE